MNPIASPSVSCHLVLSLVLITFLLYQKYIHNHIHNHIQNYILTVSKTEEIIKRKLLFDADGMGDDRRINLMMKTFFQWMGSREGLDRDLNLQRLFIMLSDAELAMKKSAAVRGMNRRELANYETIKEQLDTRINESKAEIVAVKTELTKAKHTQRNRVEYEQVVAKIDQYPSRAESKAKLEAIMNEITELEGRKEAILKRLDERRDQFSALINSVQELNQSLTEEDGDDRVEEGPVEVVPREDRSSGSDSE